ncbi:hypothetical protein [Telluria beijingensis]|uniref:hypothetical protein n=1 Tax=Telluria beijingensis TaxID=3068633 RepID=UPI0027954530|nr:hypothetical protein [Massilia sp. REN29]
MTISHRLLGIDEGRQQLSLIDTATDTFYWTLDLADFPLARDMQRLDAERVLVGCDRGFFELEIATGRVLASALRWAEVTGAHRRPDGSTLLTGFDLDGGGGVNVLTLGLDNRVTRVARRDGDYIRLMRPTASGTYLLCTNDHILETTPELVELRRFAAPGFEHAWQAERLPDGTTLVAAGYGAFMASFDAQGALVERFGAAADLPHEVNPFFYASFRHAANGNLVVANWQGHGPDNGQRGRQLLEFDAHRRLAGSWSAPGRISSLQGILLV